MVDPLSTLGARARCIRKQAFFGAAAQPPAPPPALPSPTQPPTRPRTGRFRTLRERLNRWLYGHTERVVGATARRFDRAYYPGPIR